MNHRTGRRTAAAGFAWLLAALELSLANPLAGQVVDPGAAYFREAALPDAQQKLADVTFVAFDTETTGFSPKTDRIVELAAVKFRAGRILEKKAWLINPERPIPDRVERVHGITAAMVQSQPPFAEIYPEFEEFAAGCVLIAHNALFDVRMVNAEVARADLARLPNPVVDSLRLFRSWYPEAEGHTLEGLMRHTGESADGYHRALADSVYIALIFSDGASRRDESMRLQDVYAAARGPGRFEGPACAPVLMSRVAGTP